MKKILLNSKPKVKRIRAMRGLEHTIARFFAPVESGVRPQKLKSTP